MSTQPERFLKAREVLNENMLSLWDLGHEVNADNDGEMSAGFFTEMNDILAQYGFTLAMFRRDTNVVVSIEDTQKDQIEGGVFLTEAADTIYEWRNDLFNSIISYFNTRDQLR